MPLGTPKSLDKTPRTAANSSPVAMPCLLSCLILIQSFKKLLVVFQLKTTTVIVVKAKEKVPKKKGEKR